MNIFFLSIYPKACASYHCDKHLIKMISEYSQLLSTYARDTMGLTSPIFFRSTHKNHPCNVWLRQSEGNVAYLIALLGYMLEEYDLRYKKGFKFSRSRLIHKAMVNEKIPWLSNTIFPGGTFGGWEWERGKSWPKTHNGVVYQFRFYYREIKGIMAKWEYSQIPHWMIRSLITIKNPYNENTFLML